MLAKVTFPKLPSIRISMGISHTSNILIYKFDELYLINPEKLFFLF